MKEFPVIIVSIVGSVVTAISLLNTIRVAVSNQKKAFSGDEKAATRLILPCYKPLFRGLVAFFFLFGICLSLTFIHPNVKTPYIQNRIIEYYCFTLMGVYAITPVLLMQSSVSQQGFWRTVYTIVPWWLLCNILWSVATFTSDPVSVVFNILFVIAASVVPLALSILILTKVITTRVQTASSSNRNSIELLLFYSFVFCVSYIVMTLAPGTHFIVATWMTCFSFATNMIFPFFIYRALLADTKFWRGLGRHNRKGLSTDEELRKSGVELHRPTMEFGFAASTFQTVISEINDISIDFAFLQLEKSIGEGATSKVYSGRFKTKLVAIKLSTPPEVTEEAIGVFVAEAKIAARLSHPNIVQFIGICIRPPQIAMVFEFCEGGNLKSHLAKHHKTVWTPVRRVKACIDAAKGIACLHAANFIHRDLKAENFFVGKKHVVKLGDFGESTEFRNEESVASRRMSVCGTVSFMAPELIRAARHYTSAIDIYALGVTFWEIWTGEDPYADKTQFQIYDGVMKGLRPTVPPDAPIGFKELLDKMWLIDSKERPSAEVVVLALSKCIVRSDISLVADTEISSMSDATSNLATVSDIETGLDEAISNRKSGFEVPNPLHGTAQNVHDIKEGENDIEMAHVVSSREVFTDSSDIMLGAALGPMITSVADDGAGGSTTDSSLAQTTIDEEISDIPNDANMPPLESTESSNDTEIPPKSDGSCRETAQYPMATGGADEM